MTYTSLTRTVAPPVNPVTREQVKQHLRREASWVEDDELIDGLIDAATAHVEKVSNRSLVQQTWVLKLCAFPCGGDTWSRRIDLPRPQALSITSIGYVDSAGSPQTLSAANYALQGDEYGSAVVETYGNTWPDTREQPDAVTVTYVAGYARTGAGTEADPYEYRKPVPAPIRQAILCKVQALYDNLRPEDMAAVDQQVENLVWPYRLVSV
ncbi:MAG: phage head-tail connector protein [Xanthomonadales bacterium]|nr:phage head-tail connector protein [Xanthomonadales bacterium]